MPDQWRVALRSLKVKKKPKPNPCSGEINRCIVSKQTLSLKKLSWVRNLSNVLSKSLIAVNHVSSDFDSRE